MKAVAVLAMLFLAGCAASPQKGGSAGVEAAPAATVGSMGGIGIPSATLVQPENPKGGSSQSVRHEVTETLDVATDTLERTVTALPDGRTVTVERTIPAGSRITRHVKQGVDQELGGSFMDTARQFAAELASFRWVQILGAVVLLFGGWAFVHPVGRKLIGGKDAALMAMGCGAVMMFGPFFLVKYANWFALALAGFGGYWLIARLKYKEGIADTLTATNAEQKTT